MSITTMRQASQYIRRALRHSGIHESESFDVHELPGILEKYDKVEPLDKDSVKVVTETVQFFVTVQTGGLT